ncbi:MAG TPA: hypothetical protein VIK89_06860 [Cytophagaceae bacterium]
MRSFLVIVFCSVLNVFAWGQADTMQVVTWNTPDKVLIKWLPGNFQTWINGMKYGYHIERYEVQQQGANWIVVAQDKLTSEPVKPWDLETIKKEAPNNPDLKNIDLMFLGKDLEEKSKIEDVESGTEVQSRKKLAFIMALYAQVMKNKTAEAMGTFFEDNTVKPDKIYLYRVSINMKDGLKAEAVVDRKEYPQLPAITGFSFQNIHKGVELFWVKQQHSGYVYFDVYRAESKKGPFVKVNEYPYIGEIGITLDDNRYRYTDTFPSLDKTYYYTVVGVNAFEKESNPSAVLEVKAKYFLQQAPFITKGIAPDNKMVELAWEVSEEERPYIKGYNIFHATRPAGNYHKINDKLIPSTTFEYKDTRKDKGSSNYYTLCAYGFAGDSLCSVLKDVLLIDSIPPAPPIIISGICDTNGVVTLNWKKNPEADLLGYRIFRTYYKHKEPDRIIPGYIADTILVDTIESNSGFRKVYYGISAIDQHFNPSPISAYFEVKIPDKHPPVNAMFKDYQAGYTGILIKWIPSPSEDVKVQYLYRKSEFDFEWQPYLKLTGDSLKVTQLRDTLTKSNIWYEYALQAEDSSGLKSEMSESLRILQPEKNPFPVVKNLKAVMSRENKMIKLTWEFDMNATGFKILRGKKGDPIETYEFVSGTKREFYDKWLTPNTEYVYAIIAEVPGGRRSLMSNKVEVKY